MEVWEFQPQVDKGCKLLDERLPGWEEKINLEELYLSVPCQCVLGQLSVDLAGPQETKGFYDAAYDELFWLSDDADAEEVGHGFTIPSHAEIDDFEPLTECWKQTILNRRASE